MGDLVAWMDSGHGDGWSQAYDMDRRLVLVVSDAPWWALEGPAAQIGKAEHPVWLPSSVDTIQDMGIAMMAACVWREPTVLAALAAIGVNPDAPRVAPRDEDGMDRVFEVCRNLHANRFVRVFTLDNDADRWKAKLRLYRMSHEIWSRAWSRGPLDGERSP